MIVARPLALAGLFGAAVGGPYVASQLPDNWAPSSGQTAASAQPAGFDPFAGLPAGPPDLSITAGPGSNLYESPAPLEGPVGMPLETALDWGVTRNWVYQHWARKSTGLADPELFGVRVPLVTGSGMTDVAGSLTYYFDRDGVLQRMRLRGRTADTTRIAQLATTRFAMQPTRPAIAGEQLFRAADKKRVHGELRTRPEGTLWATSPHTSFDVRFEATRPDGPYTVVGDAPRLEVPQVAAAPVPSPSPPPGAPNGAFPNGAFPNAGGAPSADAAGAAGQPIGGPPSLAPPKLGGPTAAPPPSIKPLEGYRDRFRWPG